jgi:hypothetical protein
VKRSKPISGEGERRQALAPRRTGQGAVLLRVHLWMGIGGSGRTPESELNLEPEFEGAGVPLPALAMVADLLQVCGGMPRESGAGLIAASFPDLVRAVNAARNLQRLVQGFSHAWQDGPLGGCTTMAKVEEARAGIDARLLRGNRALQQTHPGQVLCVGSLCEAARSVPGLEFHSNAGWALGPVGEARQVLHLLAPVRMEGYVEEPFVPWVEANGRGAAAGAAPRVPAVGSAAFPAKVAGGVPAVRPGLAEGYESSAFSREEKTLGRGFSRWAMVSGAAAAMLVGGLIFALRRSPPATPAPQPAAPVVTGSAASGPAAGAATVGAGKGDAVAAGSEARTASAKTSGAGTTRGSRGITFNPAEVSSLVAHADKDSGDGKFDKAIEEYRIVLRKDPANEPARQGLQRALYNKQHR